MDSVKLISTCPDRCRVFIDMVMLRRMAMLSVSLFDCLRSRSSNVLIIELTD